jgi:hypothetical protein
MPDQPPVLDSIGSKTVNEGQTLTFTVTGSDPDTGQVLTYSASNLPSGATFNPATQTFTWTPASGSAGTYQVTFTVTDNGTPPLSASETLQLKKAGKVVDTEVRTLHIEVLAQPTDDWQP